MDLVEKVSSTKTYIAYSIELLSAIES